MNRVGQALALVLVTLVSSCAPKTAAVPPVTPPKFPDFIFPAVPQGLGSPSTLERHNLGWRWLQAGDPRAADRNFSAVLKESSGFYPAEAGLGYSALSRKDNKAAAEHFDRAVVVNPRYAPALAGRGEALLALGDREMALKSFEAALVADPKLETLRSRVDVLRFRGLQDDVAEARKLADSGRLREAKTAYEAAITASPQSPFLYRELAAIERREGDLTSALTHARKATELDPNDSRGLTLVGEIYEAQSDFAKAVEAYNAAIAIEPSEALSNKIEDLRARAAFDAMPAGVSGHRELARRHSRPARSTPRRQARQFPETKPRQKRRRDHRHARALGGNLDPRRSPRRIDGGLRQPHVPASVCGASRRPGAGGEPRPVAHRQRKSAIGRLVARGQAAIS